MREAGRLVQEALNRAHREEWAGVMASAARVSRDLDVAEDCVQEAYAEALRTWPDHGIPDRPGAWLTTVAVRQALLHHRRRATLTRKLPLLVPDEIVDPTAAYSDNPLDDQPDDRLRLIFICCHPELTPEARVALTLRLVCGLSSKEVAHAFLVKEATMQARITRAKKRIVEAGLPYETPSPGELPRRLESVLDTLYLVYTAGHSTPAGDSLFRTDLCDLAVSLARTLCHLLPQEGEAEALHALVKLTDSRRHARLTTSGEVVPLSEQNRAMWDRQAIREGIRALRRAIDLGADGRYLYLACLASCHSLAESWAQTPWPQIVALYDTLLARWPSPVVALNRAVAVGLQCGPERGLQELERIDSSGALATYPYLYAARAEFLGQLGRPDEAAAAYAEAIELSGNRAESRFLEGKLAALTKAPPAGGS
jgi:RNA polymerase sigma-70 factor (ECF subfamily)